MSSSEGRMSSLSEDLVGLLRDCYLQVSLESTVKRILAVFAEWMAGVPKEESPYDPSQHPRGEPADVTIREVIKLRSDTWTNATLAQLAKIVTELRKEG